jgi:hypothetical protein
VIVPCRSAFLIAVIAGSVVLTPLRAHAQWWGKLTPADYEECADAAEKAATREAKAASLIECNAKFAGRRKLGGGYTYFDFMQNRTFDIAGPNPTAEEQKHIDEQYTDFLDRERRNTIATAFAAKQAQLQQATFETEKTPVPIPTPKPPALKRLKASNCVSHSFSCDWPRLSDGINDLKKALFGPSSTKAKRG